MVPTSKSGSLDFEDDVQEAGGLQSLARTPYARNMWAIMKKFVKFNFSEFQDLLPRYTDFILTEMDIDIEEENAAAEGKVIDSDNSFYDDDDSWWYNPQEEKPATAEETEQTRKQLEALMDENTKENYLGNFNKLKQMQANKESEVVRAQETVDNRLRDLQNTLADSDDQEIAELRKSLRKKKAQNNGTLDDSNDIDNLLSGKE